jgi:tetratricopeptide (TPR) repeat protein
VDQSNLSVCYEGIQRHYRNGIVRHMRQSLMRNFPKDFKEKLKKPFKAEEWDSIVKNSELSRSTGEISAEIKDDFDLLSVNHFFNIFEAYFDILVPLDHTKAPHKTRIRQTLLQWLKTVKTFRDPISHPSEEDLSYEDSFLVLDCGRRTLQTLKLDGVERLRELMDTLRGRPLYVQSESKVLESRLPPRETVVIEFVGRNAEIERLWEWFSDPATRRYALAGEGGKGKSALAYKFATEVQFKAPEPFQVVLWVSAKKRRFEEGTVVAIDNPDFSNFDSALNRILIEYGWVDELEQSIDRKRERVLELLNKFPALLVVDDIDSLDAEAEDATEFFSLLVPNTKSKVLFTSRRVLFGLGNTTIHVAGLPEPEALDFIRSRCKLLELDEPLIIPHAARIIAATEASPLFMEDLLRLSSVLPVQEAVKMWESRKGDEARQYALGREFDMLSESGKSLLAAACFKPGTTTFLELQAATGLSDESMSEALLNLQRLFLVPKPSLIEGEQRYNVNINTRILVRKVFGGTELWRRTEAAYKAIAGELPRARGEIGAYIRQALFLTRNNEHEKAEELLQLALKKAPNDPDLTGFLGGVYKNWNPSRVTDARETYKRAWQLRCASENTYRHWAQMEIDDEEWTKAYDAAEKGLQILGNTRRLLYLSGYARSRYARELTSRAQNAEAHVQVDIAQRNLKQALRPADALRSWEDHKLNSDIYRALVLNLEHLRQIDEMKRYLDEWTTVQPDDSMARGERDRLYAKYHLF